MMKAPANSTRSLGIRAGTPGGLLALFTDDTSGVSTNAANRSRRIAPPTADGTVSPDFNRAVNLPCAYADPATCPLPPAATRSPGSSRL